MFFRRRGGQIYQKPGRVDREDLPFPFRRPFQLHRRGSPSDDGTGIRSRYYTNKPCLTGKLVRALCCRRARKCIQERRVPADLSSSICILGVTRNNAIDLLLRRYPRLCSAETWSRASMPQSPALVSVGTCSDDVLNMSDYGMLLWSRVICSLYLLREPIKHAVDHILKD